MKSQISKLFDDKKKTYLSDFLRGSKEDQRVFLKQFYDWIYQTEISPPTNCKTVWQQVLNRVMPEFKNGLEFGCGTGAGIALARENGKNAWGFDIADVSKSWFRHGIDKYCKTGDYLNLPYEDNEFDFVLCTEVLEHILEFDIERVLSEIYRVASEKVVFTIALEEEEVPVRGYIYTHITLKPVGWWLEKIINAGFFPEVFHESKTLFTEVLV